MMMRAAIVAAVLGLTTLARAQAPAPAPAPAPPQSAPEEVPAADQRPWMGARVDSAEGGVRVVAVLPDTPALRAGLHSGDLVVALDGDSSVVASSDQLIDAIQHRKVGDRAVLRVRRAGQDHELELTLVLEARPTPTQRLERAWTGKAIPGLGELPMLAGTLPKLAAGEILLVEVWGTYCRACRSLAPVLTALHGKRAKLGVHVLAVSSEQASRVRRFLMRQKLAYPVASDTGAQLSRKLQIEYIPTFLAIQDGKLRAVHIGAGDAPEFFASVAAMVKRR